MAIDWTKPLRTKDGRKARFLGTRKTLGEFTHIVAVEGSLGQHEEFVHYYRPDGTYPYNTGGENKTLENIPERVSRYMLVDKDPTVWGYKTANDARYAINAVWLSTCHVVRVDFENGKPVAVEVVDA